MTWMEISRKSDDLKIAAENYLSNHYKKIEDHFVKKNGEKFSLFTFSHPEIAIGVEYDDEDDGDLYYPSDYVSLEDMMKDLIAEIEQ